MNRLFNLGVGSLCLLATLFMSTNAMAASHHEHHHPCHHTPPVVVAPSFGSFYTDATSTVAFDGIIPLSVTQSSSTDVSINGSGVITVETAGFYFISFGASQNSAGEPMQVQVALGGVPVTGATLASNPVPAGLLSASAIVYIPADSLVTLLNTNTEDGSFPLNLGNGIVGTPTAFLNLYKISN